MDDADPEWSLDDIIEERRRECEGNGTLGDAEEDYWDTRIADGNDRLWCPREFDGWTCINATPAGENATFACPYFVYGFDPNRLAFRVCNSDGTWFLHPASNKTWSNYTTCVDQEDLKLRNLANTIYTVGYMVSLGALLLSLAIFFHFKSLSCTRIQIHKNLFVSLALNNALWLIWYEEIIDNPDLLAQNGWGCQILHVMLQYSMVASYFWMFCEGLYLHTLLAVAFVSAEGWVILAILSAVGWALPVLLTALYAGLRMAGPPEEIEHCWIKETRFVWVLSGPVCASMIANLVFLVNIVRLLLTKLKDQPLGMAQPPSPPTRPERSRKRRGKSSRRSRDTEALDNGESNGSATRWSGGGGSFGRKQSSSAAAAARRSRKAVRATLILIPLLGLQYILTPFRPDSGAPGEALYQILSAIVASYQGLCVALLFCFCNGEVISVIKKKWVQYRMARRRHWHSCSGVTSVSACV
ncbi:calcitonin gene-related peptide type 1 receptor-like isoform X2 [Ischnura elegans]|uniref:calcitonin gene-related peptide type 1 receptor-like isoform X2 n=1 Tax=Ischnura elegans TaxID=197161 RepID=UPI001ED8A477|nr:calcitonin gene-related peptide type 1 receptor-like isoform X2 [Ischnura elegans]